MRREQQRIGEPARRGRGVRADCWERAALRFEEARRGAYNPTYLYYTLGKLQIYKLREDYRKARGAGYSMQRFHNEFVKQGSIPIKAVRRILLPEDHGPTL